MLMLGNVFKYAMNASMLFDDNLKLIEPQILVYYPELPDFFVLFFESWTNFVSSYNFQ